MSTLLRTDDSVRRSFFAMICAEQPRSASVRNSRKSSLVQEAGRSGKNVLDVDTLFMMDHSN
jgi:hypothetical protein